ncbi:MAG: chromate efflux transporter, partial [Bacteroidia bacterium]|nr:chromate efflux transporter [Bacteroidia bacterium]
MTNKPTFHEALSFWLKLGFISFGGPAGQIAILHEFLVEKKKWISESKFLHALNYCMLLPGPEAQQLATYMGWLLHGVRGGLAAGILFILPSMFILLGLSILYVSFGNTPIVFAMFNGLKPAVVAIVILALIKIAKKSLRSAFHFFIAGAAFVCLFFFKVSFPLIILVAILLSLLLRRYLPSYLATSRSNGPAGTVNESDYFINRNSMLPQGFYTPGLMAMKVLAFCLLWAAPFVAFYFLSSDYAFWKQLSVFFSQAAFVTFGGAYSVLPYVAQVSVEKYQWLSNGQMLDGLALGETTPGPLIMVLVFVGFMAGYNYFNYSLLAGSVGLLATTWYTFLPSFLFILIGAPLIERTQENVRVREMLEMVSAAVVGVILSLCLYLAAAVLFP